MKHTELMQAIIQKYEDLIRWLVKYSKPESIRYENYCKELSDLKKQLEECEESETHVIDEMDNSPYEIIFNGRTYIRK